MVGDQTEGSVLLLLGLAAGGLIILAASLLSGTSLTRDEFPTPADAAEES